MTIFPFLALNLHCNNLKALLWTIAFVAGNLLLPYVCHYLPVAGNVGAMLLPIYFFTLIAAYKFGWQVGLATAVLSPIANSLLTGMPVTAVLPVIITKSLLLAGFATLVARRTRQISIFHLIAVVLSYQIVGCGIEMLLTQSIAGGLADFRTGIAGMALQIVGGYFLLKAFANLQIR